MNDYRKLEDEELTKLAELGIAEAQEEYGYRLLQKLNKSNTELKEAVKWFTKSADQGYIPGKYNLGLMYKMGLGVEKDYMKAFALFSECAAEGLPTAKFYLGEMYREGLGVVKDENKAIELIQESFKYTDSLVNA